MRKKARHPGQRMANALPSSWAKIMLIAELHRSALWR